MNISHTLFLRRSRLIAAPGNISEITPSFYLEFRKLQHDRMGEFIPAQGVFNLGFVMVVAIIYIHIVSFIAGYLQMAVQIGFESPQLLFPGCKGDFGQVFGQFLDD